jgi:serine/threonine-protein kinase RsbW
MLGKKNTQRVKNWACLEQLQLFLAHIKYSVVRLRFSKSDAYKIELASEEALVNVIHYAYRGLEEGQLEVRCKELASPKKGLSIEIHDWGKPFNPIDAEEVSLVLPGQDLEQRQVGGLGIFYMTQVMDEVHYQRVRGKNILRLIKYFP